MKTLITCLLALLALPSCVTSADLHALAVAQEKYERSTQTSLEKIANQTATREQVMVAREELMDASKDFKEAVEQVAKEVETRTAETLTGLPESAEGGIVGILAALAVNFYRSRTRRRDLDEVWTEVETKKPSA